MDKIEQMHWMDGQSRVDQFGGQSWMDGRNALTVDGA